MPEIVDYNKPAVGDYEIPAEHFIKPVRDLQVSLGVAEKVAKKAAAVNANKSQKMLSIYNVVNNKDMHGGNSAIAGNGLSKSVLNLARR